MCAVLACLGAIGALGCSALPRHPEGTDPNEGFSAELAHAHLENLAGLGPRLPGSTADDLARGYLERELRLAGARRVRTESGPRARHLVAEVPGRTLGRVLVVAPYPTLEETGFVDDAGLTVCLELVRAFARERPAYDVWIAFAEVTPRLARGAGPLEERFWEPVEDARAARARVTAAGVDLVAALGGSAALEDVRAVIVLEPRARPGARIARDLRSHPVFRSLFWETAAALGHRAVFPPGAAWTSPEGLQEAFRGVGLGRLLALVDESTALAEGGDPRAGQTAVVLPGEAAILEPIGDVALAGLERLMHRFVRTDAFSR